MQAIWLQLIFSHSRSFFKRQKSRLVAVAEQLTLKFSGTSRFKQVQPSLGLKPRDTLTRQDFYLKMTVRTKKQIEAK